MRLSMGYAIRFVTTHIYGYDRAVFDHQWLGCCPFLANLGFSYALKNSLPMADNHTNTHNEQREGKRADDDELATCCQPISRCVIWSSTCPLLCFTFCPSRFSRSAAVKPLSCGTYKRRRFIGFRRQSQLSFPFQNFHLRFCSIFNVRFISTSFSVVRYLPINIHRCALSSPLCFLFLPLLLSVWIVGRVGSGILTFSLSDWNELVAGRLPVRLDDGRIAAYWTRQAECQILLFQLAQSTFGTSIRVPIRFHLTNITFALPFYRLRFIFKLKSIREN